jgi:hypothetical protein
MANGFPDVVIWDIDASSRTARKTVWHRQNRPSNLGPTQV